MRFSNFWPNNIRDFGSIPIKVTQINLYVHEILISKLTKIKINIGCNQYILQLFQVNGKIVTLSFPMPNKNIIISFYWYGPHAMNSKLMEFAIRMTCIATIAKLNMDYTTRNIPRLKLSKQKNTCFSYIKCALRGLSTLNNTMWLMTVFFFAQRYRIVCSSRFLFCFDQTIFFQKDSRIS